MKKEQNGYITLYLSLTLGIMLTFTFLLLETVREETIRMETESVMDIGLYSIFGEFHRELLEQYDLFFIDTSYGEGRPNISRCEEHLQFYMNSNFRKKWIDNWLETGDLTKLCCDNVELECYMYASDMDGQVLKAQIVDYMQDKMGIGTVEKIWSHSRDLKEQYVSMDITGKWDAADNYLNELVSEKRKEILRENPEAEIPENLDNPASKVKEIRTQGILSLALPTGKEISAMEVQLQNYISHRTVSQGRGVLKTEETLLDQVTGDYLLREYFMEKCSSFSGVKEKSVLKYQIEYLLFGNSVDLDNLEATVEKILHIREAVNFAYLISDAKKMNEAENLALLVSLLLFSPEIKEAVKATIVFAWCYAESVKDVRILLDGNKLPMLKSEETWNTPLSKLLIFSSFLEEYEIGTEGISYEDYLRFFLTMESETEILYRFMDLCEMDIRATEGNSYFQMDGCVGAVKARANVSSNQKGYEITRTYSYK